MLSMNTAQHAAAPRSNNPPARNAGRNAGGARKSLARKKTAGRHSYRLPSVVEFLKKLWPSKPSLELHFLTGCSEDHAQRILAERVGFSADILHDLLHSPHGLTVLKAMMANCREPWWLKLSVLIDDMEYQQRRAAMLAAIDADKEGQRK